METLSERVVTSAADADDAAADDESMALLLLVAVSGPEYTVNSTGTLRSFVGDRKGCAANVSCSAGLLPEEWPLLPLE